MNLKSDTQEMPYNIEAEQLLLGKMLINNNVYYNIDELINAKSFYLDIHSKIFDAITNFLKREIAATPITLKNLLKDSLSDVGGADYLVTLASKASVIIDIQSVAKIVYEMYTRRNLIEIGESIVNQAFKQESELSTEQQIVDAEKKLYDLSYGVSGKGQIYSISDSVDQAIVSAEAAFKNKDSVTGIPTSLTDLDRLLGGLNKSDLIIIAARPSMGKTALAVNIAVNASKNLSKKSPDESVVFFSLEMSSEQLALRILSIESGLNSSRIRTGFINKDDFNTVIQSSKKIKTLPIFIDDTPSLSINNLRSRVRRLCRSKNVSLILVDYLQLLRGSRKYSEANRVQEVSEVTQGLKSIAKEMNIPVLALSQLSRSVEQRDDKKPQLSDLRDSGSIEQDSDIVIFIYREAYYLMRKQPSEGTEQHVDWQHKMEKVKNSSELIVAKQRNGPIGNIKLHFDINTTKFSNSAHTEDFNTEL